jgi:serine/threonine-protein kinase
VCEDLIVQRCPTCGKLWEPTVRFCPEDGTALSESAPSVAVAAPPVAATETAPPDSAVTPAAAPRQPMETQKIQLPVVVGNRYRLEEVRGGGGMAKVYRAVDLTLERAVAVKLINPELRREPEFDARFHREARIASQLNDPHIVVVHDFGIDPAHGPYLVMEFLQGMTLRERLAHEGPLPVRAGIQLSAQLLLALIHAHNKNIVHRDIKPDNIFFLNQSGVRLHVRVLDFGIARILRGDEPVGDQPLTQPGAVLGTPRYMSPEQLAGQPVDARSDLYSAAMVMHEALTGKLPFITGKPFRELCPDAPPDLGPILEQCLKPNPNERPATAVEVYLRLQELGKASGILLLPPGAMEKLLSERKNTATDPTLTFVGSKPRGRAWWLLLLLALAVAAGAALVWVLFLRS